VADQNNKLSIAAIAGAVVDVMSMSLRGVGWGEESRDSSGLERYRAAALLFRKCDVGWGVRGIGRAKDCGGMS
jgi:hypothetical protein